MDRACRFGESREPAAFVARDLSSDLRGLYDDNIVAKILHFAQKGLAANV